MFYRYVNETIHKENEVIDYCGISLFEEFKSTYEYPVKGWYYFNSDDEANSFFIEKKE